MSILYHGSPNHFTQFDYRLIGRNGTQNGYGFYFTPDYEFALSYALRGRDTKTGFIYRADFLGKKALSDTRVTISKTVLRKLLLTLHNMDGYLNNYGEVPFEGLNQVLATAMSSILDFSETDTEIIGGIINSLGAVEPVLKLLHDFAGYDHVKVRDPKTRKINVYVILVPSAIQVTGVKQV